MPTIITHHESDVNATNRGPHWNAGAPLDVRSHVRVLQAVDDVLEAVYLLEITQAILDDATAADPPFLRSLDAIHLVTALSVGDAGIEVIAYDRRFADAARANGLSVVQPGHDGSPKMP